MGVTRSRMRTWAATMALLGASGVMAPIAAQSAYEARRNHADAEGGGAP
jgi:hypothetical protein